MEDFEKDLQLEVFQRISKIRFGGNGYFFVVSYDGVELVNDTQADIVGKNLWESEDPNGLKVIQEQLRHSITVLGVLPTFYDVRNRISHEVLRTFAAQGLQEIPCRHLRHASPRRQGGASRQGPHDSKRKNFNRSFHPTARKWPTWKTGLL